MEIAHGLLGGHEQDRFRHNRALNEGPVSGRIPRPGRSTLRSPLQLDARPGPRSKLAVPLNGNGGVTDAVSGFAAGSPTAKVDDSANAFAERVIVIRLRRSMALDE